jgi:predicted dehydrogenase
MRFLARVPDWAPVMLLVLQPCIEWSGMKSDVRGTSTMSNQNRAGDVLRVGVVGLGYAGEQHTKGFAQLPNVKVVALAGLEEDRLHQLAQKYSVPDRHRDYQELVSRSDLDIVSVCVPNYLHAPVTIAALESGKHVLCEKPLARSYAEAESMVVAAERANRVLQVAFNHRARGDVQVLKRYLEGGRLGDLYHVKASWMRRSGIPGIGSWFTNKEMAGGGPLIDLGVHVLDLALFLLGEPRVATVSAATYAKLGPQGRGGYAGSDKMMTGSSYEVEDLATAFIRLSGGATLLLEASWAVYGSAGDDFGVSLYGTEGGAEIKVENYNWQDTLRIYTDVAGVSAEVHPKLFQGEGHMEVVRNFVTAVRSGDWAQHTGAEGLYRTRIIDACYASAIQGREVVLGEASVS